MTGTSANPEFLCPLRDRAGTGPVYMAAASVSPGKRQQHLRAQRTRTGRLRVRFRESRVRDNERSERLRGQCNAELGPLWAKGPSR